MQQRVNLARALVMDPQILLMDEPFASLDAQTRELMQEELLRIWAQASKTVLFITHQIDEAIYLSDRVVVFSGRPGKVKEIIPVDIERPRRLRLKREPRFHKIEDRIWSLIEDDVKGRMTPTRAAAGLDPARCARRLEHESAGSRRRHARCTRALASASGVWRRASRRCCGTPAHAADLTPFRIGISAPVVTIFPVWMGEAGGFYEKEGLKVEVVTMEGGSRGVQVLMSGEIQAMHVGLAPVVLANKQGADLRLVTSTGNTIPITIFGTPAIKSMADLKGKTIGISTSARRPTSPSASRSRSSG